MRIFRKTLIPKAAHKSHQLKKNLKIPSKQNNTKHIQIQTNPDFFQHQFLAITKVQEEKNSTSDHRAERERVFTSPAPKKYPWITNP